MSFINSSLGVTVTGVIANNKVYDGTTTAVLVTSGAGLAGVLPVDTGNVSLVTSGATGIFADKNAGTGKIVTVSGLTLSGSAAGNYALTQPSASASISAVGLTVTGITAASKVYDGTAAATLITSGGVLVGVVSGDVVALNNGTAVGTFADRNVGTSKAVTVVGLALNGASSANYTLTPPAATASITRPFIAARPRAPWLPKSLDGSRDHCSIAALQPAGNTSFVS